VSIFRRFVNRVRVLCQWQSIEDELAEELHDHLEREVERQRTSGVPEDEARRRAVLRTGSIESLKEQVRDERGGRWLLDAVGDLRIGVRGLRRAPGFTAAVVLSLALGVAAVTAIASLVNSVVLRPLPYPAADRLHLVRVAWNEFSASLSAADFLRLREASGDVADAAAYRFGAEGFTLLGQGDPEVVSGAAVTAETARVLGVPAALGRWFSEDEDAPEALIGDALWRSRFAGSPAVLGQTLVLDRGRYTIVGVMPPGYDVPGQSHGQVWLSAPVDEPSRRGPFYLWVALRLRPGVAAEQAAAHLTTAVSPVLEARYQAEPAWRYVVTPMKDVVVGDTRVTLWLFLAAAGLVLLIASVNVANLMLARGASRMRELAVRASLGGRRERLVRQLLAEAALVGCGSAIVGLVGAWGLIRLIVAEAGALVPRSTEIDADLVTAAVAAGLGVGTALITGAAPALWLTGRRLMDATRTGGRTATAGRAEGRIRRVMVVAEVALALCVLVATVLLVKTMGRVESQSPGFNAEGVLSFRLVAPPDPYDDVPRLNAYLASIDDNLRRIPGVTHVAFAESLPPDRLQQSNNYTLQGEEPGTAGRSAQGSGVAQWNIVSPEFFDALEAPVLHGRVFTAGDEANTPAVAVVSRTFAEKHFPRGDVVGRRLKGGDWDAAAPWLTIVGVVGDMPYDRGVWGGLSPTVYVPRSQNAGSRWQFVLLRTVSRAASAAGLAPAVRAADPRVPLRDVATMSERLTTSAAVPRFRMRLFTALAAVSVALAVIGLYGILAYQVSQRRKETAVRRALGATSPAILARVVGSALGLTIAGTVIGIVAAFGLTRSLAAFLFGVAPDDPSAFALAAVVLLGAATLASVMPALRAVTDDPLAVLRED
jgi:predicted permease